jgi:hypothetical protein
MHIIDDPLQHARVDVDLTQGFPSRATAGCLFASFSPVAIPLVPGSVHVRDGRLGRAPEREHVEDGRDDDAARRYDSGCGGDLALPEVPHGR